MVMAYNLSKDNSLFSNLPLCINEDENWESCDVIEKKTTFKYANGKYILGSKNTYGMCLQENGSGGNGRVVYTKLTKNGL